MPAGGFSRDHTIGNQIRQVIGDGEWNKQVTVFHFYTDIQQLYDTLKADQYKVPIELFLEKATLPKPAPKLRTYGPPKAKDAIKVLFPEIDLSSLPSKRKRSGKAKSDPAQPPKDPAILNADADANSTVIDGEIPTRGETGKDKEAERPTIANQKSSAKEPTISKRRKKSQPAGVSTNEPPDPAAIERETVILSLVKENQGVLELVPRLDLLYAAHAEVFFPDAQPRVDSKIITHTLETLESRRQIVRIILQAETSTKTQQFKFIYTLPEIDAVTDPRVNEIRDRLHKEALSYQPAPISEPHPQVVKSVPGRAITRIESAPSTPKVTGVAIAQRGTTTEAVPTASKNPTVFVPIPRPSVAVAVPPPRVQPPKKRGRPLKQSNEPSASDTQNQPIQVDSDSSDSEDGSSHSKPVSNSSRRPNETTKNEFHPRGR